MIDEYWTWIFYGYRSDELKPQSNKPIVARCDGCCKYRLLKMQDYHDLCKSCAHLGRIITKEWRRKISEANKGRVLTKEQRRNISRAQQCRPPITDETRHKLSNARKNRRHTDESKRKMSESKKGTPVTDKTKRKISECLKGRTPPPRTEEHCRNISRAQQCRPPITDKTRHKMSSARQGISYEEWTGFSKGGAYCEKFDEACRERIRAKYGYRCFVCDKPQDENITKNGKMKNLSVHHTDTNKNQGCDGVRWKLVPLCMSCHGKSHFDPLKSRIDYLVRVE